MKNYLPLVLGLALAGEAKAEEPKECIDSLNLTVEIKPSVKTAGIEATIDSALQEVQGFYQREVQLPVTWKYQRQREPDDIHITFGDADDCIQDWFPYPSKIIKYITRNGTDEEMQKELESIRLGHSPKRSLIEQTQFSVVSSIGIADPDKRMVYVFPQHIKRNMVPIILSPELTYASVIAHELSHVLLGGGHAKTENINGTPDKFDIMYRKYIHPWDEYSFSDVDKQKIQSQICKPEEQK